MLINKLYSFIFLLLQGGGPAPPPPGGTPPPPGLPVPLNENIWVLAVIAIAMIVVVSRKRLLKSA